MWKQVSKEEFFKTFVISKFTVGSTITECSNDYAMTEFIPKGEEESTHRTEHNHGLLKDPDYFLKSE